MEPIRTKLSEDLKTAMREKDSIAIKAIRSLMAAIDNAGAVPVATPKTLPMSGGIAGASAGLGSTEVPRRTISDDEVRGMIRRELDEIGSAITEIGDPSKPEAEMLSKQADVLRRYL